MCPIDSTRTPGRRPASLILLVLGAGLLGCCSRCKPPARKPPSTAVTVRVARAMGAPQTLRPILRATYAERAAPIGRVPPAGVLYAYPRDRALGIDHSSGAQAMDVVLLDAKKRVVRVAAAVNPRSRHRISVVPRLFRYAILLPARGARAAGLVAGAQVSFTLPERAAPHRVLTPVDLNPRGRRSVRVQAELALTDAERMMGLMWRTQLPARGGMLFRFERAHVITFWMKNTLIPLDMIFFNDDFLITGVVHRAKPKNEGRSWVGNVASRYVLEVPGGFARRYGIRRGDSVSVNLP